MLRVRVSLDAPINARVAIWMNAAASKTDEGGFDPHLARQTKETVMK